MSQSNQPTKILTIGGSDSGGAAGIQADLKTLTVLGVYGMSVITIVTAQNSLHVADVYQLPPEFVASQLDAVLSDYGAQGTKTGFIGQASLIKVIAEKINAYKLANVVIDPVLVNHRGEPMFPETVTQAYIDRLLPVADLITPNLREAELLTGVKILNAASMNDAANHLFSMGSGSVLITGRRVDVDVVDLLLDGKTMTEFRSPWIDSPNRHGSGDTLSAAICAFLSLNFTVSEAVDKAREYTFEAIKRARQWRLGAGHGPVSSWGNRQVLEQEPAGSKDT
ncbi:MAG: bifunctional hydroxymethylpyrimidine kinase/phosphomethylpyrimidine kinase [Candidatus Promineifilaceae bacterium]